MRLITHNMLQCHVKGCNANNFPLQLQEVVLEQEEAEMNEDFLRNMLGKIEYEALVATCLKVLRRLFHLSVDTHTSKNGIENSQRHRC